MNKSYTSYTTPIFVMLFSIPIIKFFFSFQSKNFHEEGGATSVKKAVKTITSFSEIDLDQIGSETLVVTDVNDTLIAGDSPLWQKSTLASLSGIAAKKLSMLDAEKQNLLANLMMQKCDNIAIANSVRVFRTLKEQGIPTLALTAAFAEPLDGVDMAELLVTELSKEDLSFSGLLKGPKVFNNLKRDTISEAYPILLEEGILLTNGSSNPKGSVLKAYINALPEIQKPRKILFFDDSEKNINSVLEIFSKVSIEIEAYQVKASPQGIKSPSDRELKVWESLIDRSALENRS